MSRPGPDAQQLQAQVHATRLQFLTAELEVADTMLDTAASSADREANARRRARAREACDEVARHLARPAELGLTPDEEAGLAAALARVRARFDAER